MYGLETLTWTMNDLAKLEVAQNKVGRIALGANKYVAVEAIRGEAGWSTFSERIEKGILRYRVRLERMDGNRWAKKVFEWAKQKGRWNKMCDKKVERYRMHGIMSGESMARWTNEKWKREINRRVQDTGVDEWHRSMQAKSSLEYYLAKPKPKSETFYDCSVVVVVVE